MVTPSLRQAGPHRQMLAAFGDGDALGAARQERRIQFGFEFLDGLGHRGLAQVQAAGGGADAAQFGHFQPGPQLMVLHDGFPADNLGWSP